MASTNALLVYCSFLVPVFGHANQHATVHFRAAQLHVAAARNVSAHSLSPVELQDKFGDVTCMRWTGGGCKLSGCKAERGRTVCEEGLCKCAPGLCATAAGTCEAQGGEWKGVHSIKFAKPYDQEYAYLSAGPFALSSGYKAIGSADSAPSWRVALLVGSNKHVRLEHVQYPGHYLGITNGGENGLLPELTTLEEAAPHQITFVVQETHSNGGGLQLWHPGYQAAITPAGGALAAMSGTETVTVCDAPVDEPLGMIGIDCTGRALVQFTPALPSEVVSIVGSRVAVHQVLRFNSWQQAVLITMGVLVMCGAFTYPWWLPMLSKDTPGSSDAAS